ncbi:MAG TPA: LysM peptidoglycan-binding domain-containing protein [Chitinophagales bacterium]|nr:LysM peptidoglycan-binding domain-containing protein [Chitinophagales bacterium]
MKRICVLILFSLWVWSVTAANPAAGDSVGVKVVDGKSLVVYKLSAGETAYAVSRKYGINFKDLSVANSGLNMDQLKAGQEILVPTGRAANTSTANSNIAKVETAPREEVVQLKEAVIEAPVVAVPKTPVAETVPEKAEEVATTTEAAAEQTPALSSGDLEETPATVNNDKSKSFAQIYGGYLDGDHVSKSEKGVATWIESAGIEPSGDRFYALHNSAPIGSVVKVRNMMNNRTIYAKVIGTLSESEVQEKVMIKLSAGAAERLNVLDNRFVSEITYFIPDEQASK